MLTIDVTDLIKMMKDGGHLDAKIADDLLDVLQGEDDRCPHGKPKDKRCYACEPIGPSG